MAAGKTVGAKTKQARGKQKAEARVIIADNQLKEPVKAVEASPDTTIVVSSDTRNFLTITQWLSVISIFVSILGIY